MNNFSLINFLERIVYLEEKFCNFLLEYKKKNKFDIEKFKIDKEVLINDIIMELIPITDSMEMFAKTLEHNQLGEVETLVLIFKFIKKFYLKFNVKQISKTDITFNPDIHEAIGVYYDNNKKKNTIKSVLQTGYIRNKKLLRPALVIVYN